MMRNFVASIKEGRDIAPTLADGLRTQEVIDAAVEAAKRGVWLDVPQVE
jgi:predicted dehydrogenase